MTRSFWKLKFNAWKLMEENGKVVFFSNNRRFWIIRSWLGKKRYVTCGTSFRYNYIITKSMIGMNLGQLCPTKKKVRHKIKKKKKK